MYWLFDKGNIFMDISNANSTGTQFRSRTHCTRFRIIWTKTGDRRVGWKRKDVRSTGSRFFWRCSTNE